MGWFRADRKGREENNAVRLLTEEDPTDPRCFYTLSHMLSHIVYVHSYISSCKVFHYPP